MSQVASFNQPWISFDPKVFFDPKDKKERVKIFYLYDQANPSEVKNLHEDLMSPFIKGNVEVFILSLHDPEYANILAKEAVNPPQPVFFPILSKDRENPSEEFFHAFIISEATFEGEIKYPFRHHDHYQRFGFPRSFAEEGSDFSSPIYGESPKTPEQKEAREIGRSGNEVKMELFVRRFPDLLSEVYIGAASGGHRDYVMKNQELASEDGADDAAIIAAFLGEHYPLAKDLLAEQRDPYYILPRLIYLTAEINRPDILDKVFPMFGEDNTPWRLLEAMSTGHREIIRVAARHTSDDGMVEALQEVLSRKDRSSRQKIELVKLVG
jgi:hypothetical protein